MINVIEVLTQKRDGKKLSRGQITGLVDAYTRGDVPDYQASAFLMAAFCRGMDAEETAALTQSMLHSGEILDLSDIEGPKVDKHSTGGVGDKVSLVLTPIVAAAGIKVPMISGRGLGLTGGTRDKLEAIPGFRTDLSIAELRAQLAGVGAAIIGQTESIAPADKLIYSLRDVTATVDFIPFISASIMSKKLAEGLDGLVLDVKCGRGAFMTSEEKARELAESMVSTGLDFGVRTSALLTRMDEPLGSSIGNWIEVSECIRFLQGDAEPDLEEVVIALCGEMLLLGGSADSAREGREKSKEILYSGEAYKIFCEMVEAQGGRAEDVSSAGIRPGKKPRNVYAPPGTTGFVGSIHAGTIGWAATDMGVGRSVKEDPVDFDAGIVLHKRSRDAVTSGDLLATFYTAKDSQAQSFHDLILDAYEFQSHPPSRYPVVVDRLTADGWEGSL